MALTRVAAGADARASAASRRAAVHGGRRPALVAAGVGPGRSHAHLRRSDLVAVRHVPLCRGHGRSRDPRRERSLSRGARASQRRARRVLRCPRCPRERATLFEHCARALDRSLSVGSHGLPLFGGGDWNDGMNRVGVEGKGESVWLGWFLHATLCAFAPLAESRGEPARATAWRQHADGLQESLEREAWDGDWYRRGYFDDGTPLGSAASDECRIDSIAQSWGVISGAADPVRSARAMAAVDEHLVRREERTGPALHAALRSDARSIRATSRDTRPASGRTAVSTRMPPSGRCSPSRCSATATRPRSCSRS